MIEKTFYFFSFLRYSNFCPDIFGHVGKRLAIKKLRLIPNLMTLQTGKQTITK